MTSQHQTLICPPVSTLPHQLFDPGKQALHRGPTLHRGKALVRVPLFEWGEGEGPVGPGAEALAADGLLAHQRRGGGEDLLRAAGLLLTRL